MTITTTTVTIAQLRDAIPKHCFERSTTKSIAFLVRDLALIAALAWSAFTFIPTVQSNPVRIILWQLYGYVQGLFGVGLWIIAHECGHGAFSPSQTLNDWCGLLGHSLLMVPYHSWRITHHRHHNYVAHMEKDTAFAPDRAEEKLSSKTTEGGPLETLWESMEDTPIVALVKLLIHQLFGWPVYMLFTSSAGVKSGPDGMKLRWYNTSHFHVFGGIFTRAQWKKILISDLALVCVLFPLYKFQQAFGWAMVLQMYLLPWLWVHHWLGELIKSDLVLPW